MRVSLVAALVLSTMGFATAVVAAECPGGRPATAPCRPEASKVSAHALDLEGLETRLRETSAIGVFTKLSLKNQVEDLLEEFRKFHAGQHTEPLPELRERFNLLLMKVLSLLQEKDPALAGEISASREALWAVLVDPEKFARVRT
jgi:hypothetical protein